jgi:hypothetical protein
MIAALVTLVSWSLSVSAGQKNNVFNRIYVLLIIEHNGDVSHENWKKEGLILASFRLYL